jgi:uncharacterized protein (TIRG00374 family)
MSTPGFATGKSKMLITMIKVALAVALLAYLIIQAQREAAFTRLIHEPKQWMLLAAGLICSLVSTTLSFLRWHVLVRALNLPFRLTEAIRLGALGFMLNFVSLGSIGGDFFKAIFLAHGQPGRRTEAVASVVADRLLGLLTMLAIASIGILVVGLTNSEHAALALLCRTILIVTTIGMVVAGLLLFVPGLSGPRLRQIARTVPLIGSTVDRLLGAVQMYRNQKGLVLLAAAICVVVDLLYVTAFYLIALGLPVQAPTWAEHLVVVPVATMAGAIPATPNGLGALEAAVNVLYRAMPGGANIAEGDGTLVTLAYRLTTMVVALVGFVYYLCYRTEVREVIVEAEELGELE